MVKWPLALGFAGLRMCAAAKTIVIVTCIMKELSWVVLHFLRLQVPTPWDAKWRKFGKPLGDGGQGEASRVLSKSGTRKHGVLKQLKREHQNTAEERQRFKKEADIVGRTRHRGIPRLLDTNTADAHDLSVQQLYFVTEFAGGLALHKYIPSTLYTADESIVFTLRLLDVLEHLHLSAPAIIHRDIKPQNILVRGKLDPVLIDFGIAFSEDGSPNAPVRNDPGKIGNAFLRISGVDNTSGRLDVTQCCGILFYLLTNSEPLDITTGNNARPHRKQHLTWIAEVTDGNKDLFLAFFDKAFAEQEVDRFGSVLELREALNTLIDKLEIVSPRTQLIRSALGIYAGEESSSAYVRYETVNNSLVETLSEFGDAIHVHEEEFESLSRKEILAKGTEQISQADGQALIDPAVFETLTGFLDHSAEAPENPDALKAALEFYPAISKYVQNRLMAHKEAQYVASIKDIESGRQDALKKYQDFLEQLQKELGLTVLSSKEIEAYQQYIDTINQGFDGEFRSIKALFYPWVWKFGLCVYESHGAMSSHRLYRIPKGSNALLIMKTKEKQIEHWLEKIRDAQREPLGEYSQLFAAVPLHDEVATNFLDRPVKQAQSLLYKELQKVIKDQALPLHGELLCREQLMEFTRTFSIALGLESLEEIDLVDLKSRIDDVLTGWFDAFIRKYASGQTLIIDEQFLLHCLSIGRQDSSIQPTPKTAWLPGLEQSIQNVKVIRLSVSSCEQLLAFGEQSLRSPYEQIGPVPVNLLADDANYEKLKLNLTTVLEQRISEYEKFVAGNGFKSLRSPFYLDPNISRIFFINLKTWLETRGETVMKSCYVDNRERRLKPVEIVFGDEDPKTVEFVTVKGCAYKLRGGSIVWSLKIFSSHPLRDCVYEMFAKDAEMSYDPDRMNSDTRPVLSDPKPVPDRRFPWLSAGLLLLAACLFLRRK